MERIINLQIKSIYMLPSKKNLKELITRNLYEDFFKVLQENLKHDSNDYNKLINHQANYNKLKNDQQLGISSHENSELGLNKLNRVLINFTDSLTNSSTSFRPVFYKSNRQTAFVGRDKMLKKIDKAYQIFKKLKQTYFLIISGIGGVGKTCLAEFFIDKINSEDLKIYKAIQGDTEKLQGVFNELARQLGHKGNQDEGLNDIKALVLRKLPAESILFLDDIKNPSEITSLYEYFEQPVFVILTTQSVEPNLKISIEISTQIKLKEFTSKDCKSFFKKNLAEEVIKYFKKDIKTILKKLKRVQTSNTSNLLTTPIFLLLITRIIKNEFQKKDSGRKINLIKEVSKLIDNPNNQEEFLSRICDFPFQTILKSSTHIENLLLAISLFDRNRIPLTQLFKLIGIANEESQKKDCDELAKWPFFDFSDEAYVSPHSIMHAYLVKQFRISDNLLQSTLTEKYIQVWLEKLASDDKIIDLFPLRIHVVNAIEYFIQSRDTDNFQIQLRSLKANHFLGLQKILPAKSRIRLFFRLLEEQTQLSKIAFLFALLAESFLRAGKLISSQSFARQSIIIYKQLGEDMTDEDKKAFYRVIRRLGTAYRSQGHYIDSLETYNEAVKLTTKFNVLSPGDKLDVFRQRATTLREMGKISSALNSLQNAINNFKANVSDYEKETALAYALTTLGGIKLQLGKLNEAYSNTWEGMKIHEKEVGKKHFWYAYDLRLLSKIETERKKYDSALENLDESFKIYKEFSRERINTALVSLSMADTLRRKGEIADGKTRITLFNDAESKAKFALDVYKKTDKKSKYVSLSHRTLAELASSRKDYDAAMLYMEEAKSNLKGEKFAHRIELETLQLMIMFDSGKCSKQLLMEAVKMRRTLSDLELFLFAEKFDLKIQKVIPKIEKKERRLIDILTSSYLSFLKKLEDNAIDNLGFRNAIIGVLKQLFKFKGKNFADFITLLFNQKWKKSIEKGWELRSEFIRQKNISNLKLTDRLLTEAFLKYRTEDWNLSAEAYTDYLNSFPNSLHHKLSDELLDLLKQELGKRKKSEKVRVLDVLCGSGLISRKIANREFSNIEVTGIDGSKKMIELANKWREKQNDKNNYSFYLLPDDIKWLKNRPFHIVIINMSWFQIDLRTRHFLFQKLLPYLSPNCRLFITTYSADFEFPKIITNDFPKINAENNFKKELYSELESVGFNPGKLSLGLEPVYGKENWDSMRWFLELYNFRIAPSNPTQIKIVKVPRTGEDRITFTQLPVISNKIFGKNIPSEQVWKKIGKMENHIDFAYGIVISGTRIETLPSVPHIFSHVKVNLTKPIRIKYAVACVLNLENETLFLMRGSEARDFKGSWSLASTLADSEMGLKESLLDSLNKRLDLKEKDIVIEKPISIRFNLRDENPNEPWIIAMCLFKGRLNRKPEIQDKKYEKMDFSDGLKFLNDLKSKKMGDCTKSYRDLLHLKYL